MGHGGARTQPIWADDVADCRAQRARRPGAGGRVTSSPAPRSSATARSSGSSLRAAHRRRRLLPIPLDRRAAAAARARDARRPDRVRHLGRGAAAHGADAHPARARPGRRGARRATRAGWPTSSAPRASLAAGAAAGGRAPPPSAPRPAAACPRRAAWRRCCAAVGRPSSPKPSGTEIAGWPGDVEQRRERREAAGAREVGHRVLAEAVDLADRQRAARPSAGVSRRSYSAKKATIPRATACSCATAPR